jgi:hypothetical protein
MAAPTIPAANTQAVQSTGGGTIPFTQQWWNFFNSLIAYVTTGPFGPVPIAGITTGVAAAAGIVGEYLSSIKTVAAGVAIANNTLTQITSLTLTPGDWDLWGEIIYGVPTGGAATISFTSGSLWTTSAATPATTLIPADGALAADYRTDTPIIGSSASSTINLGPMVVNITINTTFFLNGFATYSATQLLVGGAIRARRRR